jgi:hypothetical protein
MPGMGLPTAMGTIATVGNALGNYTHEGAAGGPGKWSKCFPGTCSALARAYEHSSGRCVVGMRDSGWVGGYRVLEVGINPEDDMDIDESRVQHPSSAMRDMEVMQTEEGYAHVLNTYQTMALEPPCGPTRPSGMWLRAHQRVLVAVPQKYRNILSAFTGTKELKLFSYDLHPNHIAKVTALVQGTFTSMRAIPEHYLRALKASVNADIKAKNIYLTTVEAASTYGWCLTMYWLSQVLQKHTLTVCSYTQLGTVIHETVDATPGLNGLTAAVRGFQASAYFPGEDDDHFAALNKNIKKQRESGYGLEGGAFPAIAATDLSGTPYEGMQEFGGIVAGREAEDLAAKAIEALPSHAAAFGPNMLGNRPPIDKTNPWTFMSAFGRHMGGDTKVVTCPDGPNGEPVQFTVTIDKEAARVEGHKMPPIVKRAHRDVDAAMVRMMEKHLKDIGSAPEILGPKSMSYEDWDHLYCQVQKLCGEGEWDTSSKMLDMCLMIKAGEAGDRARYITQPGRSGVDAKDHQALMAPFIHICNDMHLSQLNHTNVKGLTEKGKAARMAALIKARPQGDDHVSFGFDKSANDKTWTTEDWRACQRMLFKLADVISKHDGGDFVAGAFRGSLGSAKAKASKLKYHFLGFTLILDAAYFFLPSGLNGTDLVNRYEGMVATLAACYEMYGEDGYLRMLRWIEFPLPSPPDSLLSRELLTEWGGHAKGYTLKVGDPSIGSPLLMVNEGDDTAVNALAHCEKATNACIVTALTRAYHTATRVQVWVPAFGSTEWCNTHGGWRASVEFTSTIYTVYASGEFFAIPKPLKRLAKAGWTLSCHFTYILTTEGFCVVRDRTYHLLQATRALSLLVDMTDLLFVRYFYLAVARFHMACLATLAMAALDEAANSQSARTEVQIYYDTPLYQERSMEARGVDGASRYVAPSLGEALEAAESNLSRRCLTSDLVNANMAAWIVENPQLGTLDRKTLATRLVALDAQASMIVMDWTTIVDPRVYVDHLSLGCLKDIFATKCGKLYDAYHNARDTPDTISKYMDIVTSMARTTRTEPATPSAQTPTVPPTPGPGKGPGGRTTSNDKANDAFLIVPVEPSPIGCLFRGRKGKKAPHDHVAFQAASGIPVRVPTSTVGVTGRPASGSGETVRRRRGQNAPEDAPLMASSARASPAGPPVALEPQGPGIVAHGVRQFEKWAKTNWVAKKVASA